MKNFFCSKGFIIFIAILLFLTGILLFTISGGNTFLSQALDFITTPLQRITANISNASDAALKEKQTTEQLNIQIEELKKQVQNLRTITVDYYDVKKENAQFLKYYDLKQKDQSLKFVPASVIGRDSNENFYGFTLDEGYVAGVLLNDPVITENGLIGWVYHVDANSCKVKTILSPDTKVGATDIATGDSGVVTGGFPFADKNLTKMIFLHTENKVKLGDILVTSGLSGTYPKNLQIGEIIEITHEKYDASLYAVVKPFEDIQNIKDVFIVTDFQGKAEVSITPAKERLERTKNGPNS